MKVMIKCVLTFGLLLVLSIPVYAATNLPSIQIAKVGFEKKISFVAEGLTGNASLVLTDEKSTKLFTQAIKGSSYYGKIFDLQALPNGSYTLEFMTETREILQPFLISDNGIILKEENRKFRNLPIIKIKGKLLDVSLLNNRIATVDIEINKITGELLHVESVKNVLKVERRFNMSKLERGAYVVKVRTPEKTYYKEIQL